LEKKGIQLINKDGDNIKEKEEIQYESSGFETYEWKMPTIFPNTDGGINKNG
jgi:hypothetical protein